MTASLQALPIELIEHVVTFLRFPDICCLRLACRETASKASQGVFRSYFKFKNVDLTITALQVMLDVMSQQGPACLLQACTITGIALEGSSWTRQDDVDCINLLGTAFSRLKDYSSAGGLSSLSLRIGARIEGANGELLEAEKFHSHAAVWKAAQRTFTITTAALEKSRIPLTDNFDIFGSLKGCSLSVDAFVALVPSLAHACLSSLRRLAVRLSAPFEVTEEPDVNDESTVQRIRTNPTWDGSNSVFQDLIKLTAGLPSLKDLNLHWYNPDWKISTAGPDSTYAGDSAYDDASKMIALESCALRGLKVSEEELLFFLKFTRPSIITLTNVDLTSGTYSSIFAYLTGLESSVTHYFLDDLSEGGRLIHYEAPGGPKFPYLHGNSIGPSTLQRFDKHARESIGYHFARTRPLGSPRRMRWERSMRREHGPDGMEPYDFVKFNARRRLYGYTSVFATSSNLERE